MSRDSFSFKSVFLFGVIPLAFCRRQNSLERDPGKVSRKSGSHYGSRLLVLGIVYIPRRRDDIFCPRMKKERARKRIAQKKEILFRKFTVKFLIFFGVQLLPIGEDTDVASRRFGFVKRVIRNFQDFVNMLI